MSNDSGGVGIAHDPGFSVERNLWSIALHGAHTVLPPTEIEIARLMLEHSNERLFLGTGRLVCTRSTRHLARLARTREQEICSAQSRLAARGIVRAIKGQYQFLTSFLDSSQTNLTALCRRSRLSGG